ncbi:MAG: hypothetical protein ABSE46_13065 [Terracidiphilus sp.]|jgi:hypothetical protein
MQLWTDYEGVTIDGAFPLQKLLLPEGRSAFFSTAGPKGVPTVVRLIECHFDEEEILARWRSVDALDHPNFLKLERYGQTELDGRPVVYAVFENVDANLAGVLDQGHLTVKDVAQLASSLVAALGVLHTHGFVHEHIEPRNIFAVGEVVKLRSDCIREAPEGEEGRAAKQRDVRELATVLLQALTQRESVEGIPDFSMPPPFGQIIRNGLDGTWKLEDIRAALGGLFDSKLPTARRSIPPAPKPVNTGAAKAAVADEKGSVANAEPSVRLEEQLALPLLNEERNAGSRRTTGRGDWGFKDALGVEQGFSLRSRWLGAAGIVAVVLLLSTWALGRAWNSHRHTATQGAEAISQQDGQSAKPVLGRSAVTPGAVSSPRVSSSGLADSRAGWRVISFTYNRRTEAEKKASDLARGHPELRPAVFTPSGHAPYLVSIGGVMERDAAYALARRSGSLGLPRDTYAQNYSH